MALYDLRDDELRAYRSSATAPGDLEDFWRRTLTESRALAEPVEWTPVRTGLSLVRTTDVRFSGFGGQRVAGWYHRPAGAEQEQPLPVVVHYQGYGRGRGLAHQVSSWVLAGYACLEMDTRGQGSTYGPGDTPDPVGSGPAHPGYLTRGLDDPEQHYYRRVFTDAVLAIDALADLPGADVDRVAVAGASQGGGITIAAAALHPGVRAAMPDVPFLSDFRRAVEVTDTAPYSELRRWLSIHRGSEGTALATLAYVDASLLAGLANAPALFSVALMDVTCPPSTVYAAYNAYAGPKRIVEYPYNDHEGGEAFQEVEQLSWLPGILPPRG